MPRASGRLHRVVMGLERSSTTAPGLRLTVEEAERIASTFRPVWEEHLWEAGAHIDQAASPLSQPVHSTSQADGVPPPPREEPDLARRGADSSHANSIGPGSDGREAHYDSPEKLASNRTGAQASEATPPAEIAPTAGGVSSRALSTVDGDSAPTPSAQPDAASPAHVAARVGAPSARRRGRPLAHSGPTVVRRSRDATTRLLLLGAIFAVVGAVGAWFATSRGDSPQASSLVEAERPAAASPPPEVLAPEPSALPRAIESVAAAVAPTPPSVSAPVSVPSDTMRAAPRSPTEAPVAMSTPAPHPVVPPPRHVVAPTIVVAPHATSPTKDTRSSIVRDAPF
jgi:hypothetical protein